MPREEDTSDSRQNKTEASEEANTWSLKRLPDQALPISSPLLVSRIRQQFRNIGESTDRLMRWVMGRSSLALTISRAAGLPLLTGVFDYIRRKSPLVSPMLQRTIDLPWFPRRPRGRKRSEQVTRDLADGEINRSLQPNKLYPDKPLKTLSDVEEGQPDYEAAETYPLAAHETYPSINSNLLSPPMAMGGLLNTNRDFLLTAKDTALSLQTEMTPDRRYRKESTEPLYFTVKKQPVHAADGASPEVTKNVSVSRAVIGRAPDTKPEQLHHTPASFPSAPPDTMPIMDSPETEHSTEVMPPDVSSSYQIEEADYGQTKTAEDRPSKVNWQYPDQSQGLPRVLRPLTQRMAFQQSPVETHPQVSDEGISEEHDFSMQSFDQPEAGKTQGDSSSVTADQVTPPSEANLSESQASAKPAIQAAYIPQAPASLRQPAAFKPENLPRASFAWSRSPIFLDALKRTGPSIIPRMEKHLGRLASKTILPEALTYRQGSEVLPGGIPLQLAPQLGQARRQKTWENYAPLSNKSEKYVTSIPGLTSFRYSDVPELALAPVGAAPVTASSPAARAEERGAEGIEQEGESVNAPDIDVIASDVYGILKRRLMAERERALGVY